MSALFGCPFHVSCWGCNEEIDGEGQKGVSSGLAASLSVCRTSFFFFLTDQKQGNEVKVESHEKNKSGKNARTVSRVGS